MKPLVEVVVLDKQRLQAAQATATRLAAPLLDQLDTEADFQLVYEADRVYLQSSLIQSGPVYVDFVLGKSAHRRNFGGGIHQPLAKATALNKHKNISIVDVTAGYGADAFVLASLGARLTLIERSPVLYTLLNEAIFLATKNPATQEIAHNMQAYCDDSILYLEQLSVPDYPDIIYIDPMYPHKQKSAAVKAKMQLLHHLIGPDIDSNKLLAIACQRAKKRVVVKRPKTAEVISKQGLVGSVSSKNTRYDIYHTSVTDNATQ